MWTENTTWTIFPRRKIGALLEAMRRLSELTGARMPWVRKSGLERRALLETNADLPGGDRVIHRIVLVHETVPVGDPGKSLVEVWGLRV
jgi:hypothetical protein